MAQHDYTIANAPGANVRADMNNLFEAMVTKNSGPLEPPVTFSYMPWVNTTLGLLNQRNAADSAWITVHAFTVGNKLINYEYKSVDISIVGGEVNLAQATGNQVTVIGGSDLSSLGTVEEGLVFRLLLGGAPLIKHNVTSLIIPGGADFPGSPGDVWEVTSLGSGNWRVTDYQVAGQAPGAGLPVGVIVMWSGTINAIPSGFKLCDGTDSTPNLVNRFIKGAKDDIGPKPGDLGGSTTTGATVLTVGQLPAHSFNYLRTNLSIRSAPGDNGPQGVAGQTSTATNSIGSNQSHTHPGNEPPFYVLAFLIKV